MSDGIVSISGFTSATPRSAGAFLLSRSDVERLLTPDECMAAVEDAFLQHALGKAPPPGILSVHAEDGGFHIKAALLTLDRPYFAAKTNANFPHNGARHGLPTIQGVVVLCEAVTGQPLAVMDSMAITALRTAAATAVAAKYLARRECRTALICGCGAQAPSQLRALLRVRSPARIQAYDQDAEKMRGFAAALGAQTGLPITPVTDLPVAVAASDIVITCTTARRWFIAREMIRPGTFVAGDEGSGADHFAGNEPAPRGGAGDDDVARRNGGGQIGHGRYREPGLGAERGGKATHFFRVLVVRLNARGAAHAQQRPQLRRRLSAAAANQRRPALPARQVLGRHGSRRGRAQRRDRHRIHDRKRLARDRLAQDDDALDRRQPMPRAVVREIGIGLRREIGPVEREQRRLDVKTAVFGVQPG